MGNQNNLKFDERMVLMLPTIRLNKKQMQEVGKAFAIEKAKNPFITKTDYCREAILKQTKITLGGNENE